METTTGTDELAIEFHGAARTVTGSKHLLTVDGTRVLLDAGMFQGRKELRLKNWETPDFDPKSVDHVLLSHTHIDHVGYLPRLVKLGLNAPVHCTPAAHELARLMLLDSAHIQEEDARHANKKKYSKHEPALPLYTAEDAEEALELRQEQPYDTWLELTPSLKARFLNSGHILGASFLEIHARSRGREVRIVFSADIGRFEMPLHLDPQPMPECDILLLESTYGDRTHTTTPVADQISGPLGRVLSRGGTVLIPAFAVGRSQQVTLMLRRLMKAKRIPSVPIHIDSPMAVDATGIYSHHLNTRNLDADVFEDGRLRLFPDKVELHRSVAESRKLNDLRGPRIIVSASGMLTAGRVLHHLKRLAGNADNLVMLVGYQAPGTRGRDLVDGAATVKIHGQHVPIRCATLNVHGLSGHADRDELLLWVESAPAPPKAVFLVHGEEESAKALAKSVREMCSCKTFVPSLGDRFDLHRVLTE